MLKSGKEFCCVFFIIIFFLLRFTFACFNGINININIHPFEKKYVYLSIHSTPPICALVAFLIPSFGTTTITPPPPTEAEEHHLLQQY